MPRVLVAHPSADAYGSDRQLLESVHGFLAAGWHVTVALPEPGPLVELLPDVALDVAPFPVLRKALLRPLALLGLIARLPVDLNQLVRRIRAARPDVVYVNTVTVPWWTLAAGLAGVPVLVHVHEAEEISSAVTRKLLYAPLLFANAVVANSQTTRRVLLTSFRRLARRLAVVPNGLPDSGPVDADAAVPGRIVLVGRLSPRKGVDVALEAIARLRAAGRPVSLEICGNAFPGYEWFVDQLRARAAEPDLAGAVHFAGYVTPVSTALARAEIAIAPSLGESFGNAVAETLLAGRPLVASDVQGLGEIVTDGRTGLLVPPADPAALAAAIGRLLDDPGLAARLGVAGRADALERFGADRYRRAVAGQAALLLRVERLSAHTYTSSGPAGETVGTAAPMAIVVVNFGSHRLLADGLGQVPLPDGCGVVVVDNFSSAEEREAIDRLCTEHGWELVPLADNAGFGAGVNAGVRRSLAGGASSLLLLNPDVDLTPDVLAALREHVEREPMSLVSPRLVTPDGEVEFAGSMLDLSDGRIGGRVRSTAGADVIAWLPATCLAAHRDLLERVGGFDEPYFLYWEDVDFSYRCSQAGAQLAVRDDLAVVHAGRGTQRPQRGLAKSNLYYRYNCRNRLLFAARRLPRRDVARWMLRTPVVSWRILLQGGRRQLLHSPWPLLATVAGSLAGLAIAARALIRPPG